MSRNSYGLKKLPVALSFALLVEVHDRLSSLMDGKRFQIVYPVLPMDMLGVCILLPEGGSQGK